MNKYVLNEMKILRQAHALKIRLKIRLHIGLELRSMVFEIVVNICIKGSEARTIKEENFGRSDELTGNGKPPFLTARDTLTNWGADDAVSLVLQTEGV